MSFVNNLPEVIVSCPKCGCMLEMKDNNFVGYCASCDEAYLDPIPDPPMRVSEVREMLKRQEIERKAEWADLDDDF